METIKEEKKAEYETMLQCFDSVIFYNGYSDFFRDVYKLPTEIILGKQIADKGCSQVK